MRAIRPPERQLSTMASRTAAPVDLHPAADLGEAQALAADLQGLSIRVPGEVEHQHHPVGGAGLQLAHARAHTLKAGAYALQPLAAQQLDVAGPDAAELDQDVGHLLGVGLGEGQRRPGAAAGVVADQDRQPAGFGMRPGMGRDCQAGDHRGGDDRQQR